MCVCLLALPCSHWLCVVHRNVESIGDLEDCKIIYKSILKNWQDREDCPIYKPSPLLILARPLAVRMDKVI